MKLHKFKTRYIGEHRETVYILEGDSKSYYSAITRRSGDSFEHKPVILFDSARKGWAKVISGYSDTTWYPVEMSDEEISRVRKRFSSCFPEIKITKKSKLIEAF